MATILVTDGDQRAALAIVRSLGRAGHRVVVAAPARRSLAGASRHAAASVRVPDALAEPDAFGDALAAAVEAHGVDVVLPVAEPALDATLKVRERLRASVPFPDLETFRRASDKAWVAATAADVGLATPAQVVLGSPEEARGLPASDRPRVLKPARSIQGGRKLSVSYAGSGDALAEALAELPAEAFPLLVQERVVGPGTGVFLLRWEGRTVAAFAHRRLREKPPSGGVSVLRESVPLEPALRASCEALLDRLDWRGVAMVELKVDRQDGRAHVMEINGRFWGSLQLAIDAGVDFPRLLVDLALGREVEPVLTYRHGVRSRWLMGDVDHLLLRMARSPERLDLPPGAPGRVRVLAGFLKAFLPPTREEVLRPLDPAPFLFELRAWLASLR